MGIEQYEKSERALLQRIEQLEELCRDMYEHYKYSIDMHEQGFDRRMEELGLINTNSVYTENEVLLDQHFKDAQGKTPTEQLEALTEACRKQVD